MQAIWWKVVPIAIVCGIVGMFFGEARRWFERRLFGRGCVDAATRLQESGNKRCTACGGEMVRKTAKRGANAGSEFWGCSNHPRCRGPQA